MFATSCLHKVVLPVPDGAEIIKRIPRRSVEDRTGPEGIGVVLDLLIRRFEPVLGCAPVRLSYESHALQWRHRLLSSRSY